jgi:hypothetical protein
LEIGRARRIRLARFCVWDGGISAKMRVFGIFLTAFKKYLDFPAPRSHYLNMFETVGCGENAFSILM